MHQYLPPNFRNVMAKTSGAAAKVSEHLNTWRNEQENIILAALDEELSPEIKQAILAESVRKTTKSEVCLPQQARRHKTFSGIVAWGKISIGRLFGLKWHLVHQSLRRNCVLLVKPRKYQ